MPQDYLEAVLAKIMPPKRTVKSDADLDGSDKLHAIEGRSAGRQMPRFGQPNFDAPLVECYHEYQYRNRNPLWYECEYHYTDVGEIACILNAKTIRNRVHRRFKVWILESLIIVSSTRQCSKE